MAQTLTVGELDALEPIDARAYHDMVYNRIDGRTETYDDVKGDWPDFEGGADPIAEAAGMLVLFQSNDGGDDFHNRQLRSVYDAYSGECQYAGIEYTNTAQVYMLFRDHPMTHDLVFTSLDAWGQEARDVFYLAKPEDVDAIASTLRIALPLMSEGQTFGHDTLYEIANDWFDDYRCEIVEQLVKRGLSAVPESVSESADILNAAESYAWNVLRNEYSAFGLHHEEEEKIAELLAEWAQVGRYPGEIAASEKQAARELKKVSA